MELEPETVTLVVSGSVVGLLLVVYMTWFIATQSAMFASKRRLDFTYSLIREYQGVRGTSHPIEVVNTRNLAHEIPDPEARARVNRVISDDFDRFGCYRVDLDTYVVHDITHNQRVTFVFKGDTPNYGSLLVPPRRHSSGNMPAEHQLAPLRKAAAKLADADVSNEGSREPTAA